MWTAKKHLGRIGKASLVLAALAVVPAPCAGKGRVALVVHRSNPLTALSSAELRKILLGDETRWAGKEKITILLMPPGSEERKVLLQVLLKMTDDDFNRHWSARLFQGEVTALPKNAPSAASIAKLVAGLPSAVGMLDADDVPTGESGVRVLRIDGKAPAEGGYPLVR